VTAGGEVTARVVAGVVTGAAVGDAAALHADASKMPARVTAGIPRCFLIRSSSNPDHRGFKRAGRE